MVIKSQKNLMQYGASQNGTDLRPIGIRPEMA